MNNYTFFLIGLTTGLLIFLGIWLINRRRTILLNENLSALNKKVMAQFFLADVSDFWKGKPNKVKDLPDFLERYFLYITQGHDFITQSEFTTDDEDIKKEIGDKFNFHVFIGKVRVSTFISFNDGKNYLVYERDNPNADQGLINSKKDCYGAIAFNNLTLLNKLPKNFWNEEVMSVSLIPGVAFEYMEGGDTAIMLGIAVMVHEDSLKKATNEFNSIYKMENIDKQAIEMTSKLRLTISHKLELNAGKRN